MNSILVVGLNHKVAPVEIREQLSFTPEHISLALNELKKSDEPGCSYPESEVILLSTCNRTEFYVSAQDPCLAEQRFRRYLADHSQITRDSLNDILYCYHDAETAHHLLRVASGLDSLVVGENEILGQVKEAYKIAHSTGTTGPILSTLFRYAVQAGKRVRTETEIGKTALSVATIVVELAREMVCNLSDRIVLLIGAGKISSLTARELVKDGLRCVLVANRTYERAQKLAQKLGNGVAVAVHFDALEENLAKADIVVCSTGAPHIVLHAKTVRSAMDVRPERPLLIADLAVPRDVDPAIQGIPGVRLTDIDDLQTLVQVHYPLASNVRQAAEAIVSEELDEFLAWCDVRRSAPVIRALRTKADAICEEQIEHTLRRLGKITPQQERAIRAMGQTIVGKILHNPIVSLKDPPPEFSPSEYADLIQSLFGLN